MGCIFLAIFYVKDLYALQYKWHFVIISNKKYAWLCLLSLSGFVTTLKVTDLYLFRT